MTEFIPTVTIAVSAYNEENNILNFINSVLKQEQTNFDLEKIVIISDGSTDKTCDIIKLLKSDKIQLIEAKNRIGKSSRLNQLYALVDSDIVVQSDCDVIFDNPFVVANLISPIISEPNVVMCGGHPHPLTATTFLEQAVNCTVEAFLLFRQTVRGGNNVFSADGRLLAYQKSFYKQLKIPSDMIANDAYTYFYCRQLGLQYRYVTTATVSFRSPQNLKDHLKQNTRFDAAPLRMARYFPKKLVAQEYHIPFAVRLPNYLAQFLRHPILCGYIYLVNIYCKIKAKKSEKKMTAVWKMAHTTKILK
ncbi:MAG: glycosyltransferase [Patescibacteria group bacterium]|nr:glycosyltransferase [Patescibacteria group bacterium]